MESFPDAQRSSCADRGRSAKDCVFSGGYVSDGFPSSVANYMSHAMILENLQVPWVTQALVMSADVAVVGTYSDGVIRAFNRCAESMFGYAAAEVVDSRRISELFPIDEQSLAFAANGSAARGASNGSTTPNGRRWSDLLCRHRDGSLFKALVTLSPHRDSTGSVSGYILVAQPQPAAANGSEFLEALCEEYQRQISRLSAHLSETSEALSDEIRARKSISAPVVKEIDIDALTGLPSRSVMMDRLAQMIKLAERDVAGVVVLSIDLDGYKAINDAFGHDVGDKILVAATEGIKSVIRETDTLSRVSGDEFVLVLTGMLSGLDAAVVAQKIQYALSKIQINVGDHDLSVTASIGASVFPENGRSPELLLRTADAAMERARLDGGNGVRFFSSDMTAEAHESLRISSHLRNAIDRSEFVLHYQPLIDVETGRPCCAEALIRWNHPTLGQVPPAKFIGVAERTGLIVEIGNWVLREACSAAARWHASHPQKISVAVNLSPRQFHQQNLVDVVRETLAETSLAPEYLVLELTESSLMTNLEESVETLRQLADLGVCIAIDDFGTGYSSLAYLKQLPVHRLKIDQSFVRDISATNVDRGIIEAIVGLADKLGMSVVAEGVETVEQFDALISLGCRWFQGYHFSRPLADADAQKLFPRLFDLPPSRWIPSAALVS